MNDPITIGLTLLSLVALGGSVWLMHRVDEMLDEAKAYCAAAEGMFDEVTRLCNEIDQNQLD